LKNALSIWGRCLLASLLLFSLVVPSGIGANHASAASQASDEFDSVREKWKAYLTGGDFSPADPDVAKKVGDIAQAAKENWDTLVKSSPDNYIWPDLDDSVITDEKSKSSPMTLAYQRLEGMSRAYATKGAAVKDEAGTYLTLYHNQDLLMDIKNALSWLYAKKYNENRSIGKTNWFDWCIGTPLTLNNTVVLMYDELSPEEVANYMRVINKFTPDPTKANGGKATGANLMYVATVVGVRGVIVKDAAKIAASRDAISPIFDYVTKGDGFYEDGSFLQHGSHPYTGGYGKALLANLVSFVYLLDGSTWKVTDPKLQNMYRWVYDSYEPVIYKGAMMDIIRGREISRFNQQDHVIGHEAIVSIVHLAQFAPPEHAGRLKSMVKEWIQSDSFMNFYESAPIFNLVLAKQIMDDSNVKPREELVTNRQFPNMERTVHLRPNFGFALNMSSSRIFNYEAINSENLKGWYAGDGMTYLYNSDLSQFSDDYWGTVNKYRLPGTTVDTQQRADSSGQSYKSTKNWVGGTNIAGLFGVTGMELKAWNSTLTAKKSWFMFDDEIVALGAGISSTDNRTIETIIENRKINNDGTNALTVNGSAKPADLGWSETIKDVKTIHLQGNTPGSEIGYYFPQPATVKGLREARTDQWSSSNKYPKFTDSTDITRNYMTLWEDHGANPGSAGYEYVLLPNKSSGVVSAYAKNPDIEVVVNSGDVQAVQENKLNIVAANFWNDKTASVHTNVYGFLTSDKKASVMTKETVNDLEVAVSDPTQTNTDTISLEIARAAGSVITVDNGVTVTQLSPTIKLSVNVNKAQGKTFRVKFSTGFGAIRQVVDYYAQTGELNGQLQKQLLLVLKQAEDQWNKKHNDQYVKKVQDFLKHIDGKDVKKELISHNAKTVLIREAQALIRSLLLEQ
jgi:hyaluronate lyase